MLKSERELDLMRVAASTTAEIVEELVSMVEPGVTTWDLDHAAELACRRRGVTPAFKGLYGFPACLCVAVNEAVVHGIPRRTERLEEGDIITLDFGVVYRGWYGDHARSVGVGAVDPASRRLMDTAEAALAAGIEAARVGDRIGVIGSTVQRVAEFAGYSVVREFAGHGIGRRLHEDPQVVNYDDRRSRMPLREGMVICIEPMINAGSEEVVVLQDGWTAVTVDGSRSAHFEHTVAITSEGPQVLSVPGRGA